MNERLKVFETHGVVFSGERGAEHYGSCPFTGKSDKFYVNTEKWVWDSKTAGIGGTIPQFLEHIQKMYQEQLTQQLIRKLSANRNLPESAFANWHIGWDGSRYTLPVRNPNGSMQDIRLYTLGKRAISTGGVTTGLFGAEQLSQHTADPVFLCEGEWDSVALRWLLKQVGYKGVVIGLPGAGVFKTEWIPWLSGRRVHTLYDNDGAGEEGEARLEKKLRSAVQELTFVHWPDGVSDGFDVRDYIIYGAIERNDPSGCWKALLRKFEVYPRKNPPKGGAVPSGTGQPDASVKLRPSAWTHRLPTYDEVVAVFKKWLYLENTVGIEMTLAVVASQEIEGPPVWMFLVAPPGGGKTEVLSSLIGMEKIYLQSSLTPHALISGANWRGEQDPSLIPRLNGKVLVIKDFTSILSMRDAEKDEIFGILRDAYDGRCGKIFGTGIERNYESRFTVLAAVTPRIYDLSQQHHSLGERFLKCGVGNNLHHTSERDIIRRAIDNIESDTKMKWELQDAVHSFMKRTKSKKLPALPEAMYDKLISLAMFGARMRGTVSRDTFRTEIVTSKPSAEIGSRLGIQLAKLAKSLAWIHGRRAVNEADYLIIKKVVLDTVQQRVEDQVRTLLQLCPTRDDYVTTQELSDATKYPLATVGRIVQDLNILDIVARIGTNYKYHWTLSDYIRGCIGKAELYRAGDEMNRPMRRWIKMVKRRGRPMKREAVEV